MAFFGDFHTHSVYSHGRGSVESNVLAARAKGLKAVAVTDHGVCVYPNNMHPADVDDYLTDIEVCRAKYPEMSVYSGAEANLVGNDGRIDMPEGAEDLLDYILVGFHSIRMPDEPKAFFGFWLPNVTFSFNRTARIVRNTDAYLKAMERYRVTAVAHPLRQIPCDLKALGAAAKELGVYIELNSKSCCFTPEDFETLAATGCEFVCSSDAHTPDRVGDFSALALYEAAGLDKARIANWERLPVLRPRKGERKTEEKEERAEA